MLLKNVIIPVNSFRPSVIFSTHDLHEGLKACNRVIALGADGIFRIGEASVTIIDSIFRKTI